jgi:hypothetical protein
MSTLNLGFATAVQNSELVRPRYKRAKEIVLEGNLIMG